MLYRGVNNQHSKLCCSPLLQLANRCSLCILCLYRPCAGSLAIVVLSCVKIPKEVQLLHGVAPFRCSYTYVYHS